MFDYFNHALLRSFELNNLLTSCTSQLFCSKLRIFFYRANE